MNNKKEEFEKIINYISDNLQSNLFDTICDVEENPDISRSESVEIMIGDALDGIGFNIDDLETYKKENNDFWNDKNANGSYWCDIVTEWADGMVDVYNADLWKTAEIYKDYTKEALEEGLIEGETIKKEGFEKLFMAGQNKFYDKLANNVLNLLKKYVDDLEEIEA